MAKKETKSAIALNDVIQLLLEQGWQPAGHTQSETVRVPTMRAPIFGGLGGEIRTFGGRIKFALEDRRVTVGKRTTCFYRVVGKEPQDFQNIKTTDIETIKIIAMPKKETKSATCILCGDPTPSPAMEFCTGNCERNYEMQRHAENINDAARITNELEEDPDIDGNTFSPAYR